MWEQQKAENHKCSCGNTNRKWKTIDVAVVPPLQPELLTNKHWEGNTIRYMYICGSNRKRKTVDIAVVTPLQPELLTNKYWEGNIISYVGTTEMDVTR